MFTYPFKTKLLDYDVKKVSNSIIESCIEILQHYNSKFTVSKEDYFTPDLKSSSIRNVITFSFIEPINGTVRILVPDIRDDIVYIKGVKRYLQMQIRDILFVPLHKYTKFLPDLDIHGSLTDTTISLDKVGRIPLDISVLALSNGQQYKEFLKENDKQHYEEFCKLENTNYTLTRQQQRVTEYLTLMLKVSKVLKTLYQSDYEKMIIAAKGFDESTYDKGLNLNNRRLRTIEEIVWAGLVTSFLRVIVEANFRRRKKDVNELIEPFSTLYSFNLVETQFDSPYAALSNKFRVTIGGPGGFSNNVRASVRNLHDSEYAMLDCAATPDRDRCGTIMFLAYDYQVDEIGRFKTKSKNFTNQEVSE